MCAEEVNSRFANFPLNMFLFSLEANKNPSASHYNHYKTPVKCTIMFLMDFIKIFIVVKIGRHAELVFFVEKTKHLNFLLS